MFEQEDKEGDLEQVELDSNELIADLLGTMEAIENSCKTHTYYTLATDGNMERAGECPRGAKWECSNCYMRYVIYEIQEDDEDEDDDEEAIGEDFLVCTPYAITDIRLGVYELKKVKGKRFGIFIKDRLVMELGTDKPQIELGHEIELNEFLIHASDPRLQN